MAAEQNAGYIHVAENYYIKPCTVNGSLYDLFIITTFVTGMSAGSVREIVVGYGLTLERVVQRVGREMIGVKIITEQDGDFGEMLFLLREISEEICINIKKQLK